MNERDRRQSVVAIEDDLKVLQVDIVSGKSLPSMDRNGLCDCYVAVFLDEKKKKSRSYKTEVKRCTLAPRWEFERWTIRLPKECKTLYLKAKDWDRMSRNDYIGQASIQLQNFKDEPAMVGLELKNRRGQSRGIITLRVAIKSDPMPVYFGLPEGKDAAKTSSSATEAFVRVLSASVPNRPNRILDFLESTRGANVNLNTAIQLGGRVAKVATERRGLSPLMFALLIADKKKRRQVVKKMLDMGASPHYRVEGTGNPRADQLTPVYYAAMGGLLRSALLLLHYCTPQFNSIDHPAHSLLDGNTPLLATIMWNREATMRGLLRNGANPNLANDTGVTPLILAANKGRPISVIRALVRAGADVNIASSEGATALFEYARHGDVQCVEYLLRKGATQSVHSSGLTPLLRALSHRRFAIVPSLIDSAARDGVLDVFALHQNSRKTVSKFNALALAALNTRKSLVRHLIASGANHKLPVVLCDQPITIHDLLDRFGFGEFID